MIKLTLKNVGEQKCCHPFLIFSPVAYITNEAT